MSVPKIVAFDLDGTLTKSKTEMTSRMASLLSKLSAFSKVAVISGGSFEQFEKQILPFLESFSNITLLPGDGSERFEYDELKKSWKLMYKKEFSQEIKKKVIKEMEEIISSGKFEIPEKHYGSYLEDRDTEITFSAMGQSAPLEEKSLWDSDQKKRQKIKAEIEKRIPEISAGIGGTTSIDILPKGFDKARGLGLLIASMGISPDDVVFVGDAVFPGGNDYSVFKSGIKTFKTGGPEETEKIIENLLGSDTVPKGEIILPKNPVAYFCTEYALADDSKMYAGGLGVLAGDYILEAKDKDMPLIAIGLKYGDSIPEGFSCFEMDGKKLFIEVEIGGNPIKAVVWHKAFSTNTHLFLIDTNIKENKPEDKEITSKLYDSHFYNRLKQQIILGIGGVHLLEVLDISPSVYHINEGHTAFAGVAVMVERPIDLPKVVGTKHTILSEAGLHVSRKDFSDLLSPYCQKFSVNVWDVFKKGEFALDADIFSTTQFLISISQRKNGVSVLHTVFEKKRHANSELIAITNGVYKNRWQAPELKNKVLEAISSDELLSVKRSMRDRLCKFVEEKSGKKFDPNICTMVWARRFAAYKRPGLLFSDPDKLIEILSSPDRPIQIIISGKAHEADEEGQKIVERIVAFSNDSRTKGKIVYLPEYSISIARTLAQGADIWLNTPERGKEACGTSGMKASLNGALQLSISDGWVDEEKWNSRGWILPEDNTSEVLYNLLENEILPCFHDDPASWAQKMLSSIELISKSYTTDRMMKQYMKELYMI